MRTGFTILQKLHHLRPVAAIAALQVGQSPCTLIGPQLLGNMSSYWLSMLLNMALNNINTNILSSCFYVELIISSIHTSVCVIMYVFIKCLLASLQVFFCSGIHHSLLESTSDLNR